MPIYVYHCEECGEQFEKMVSFSQANQMMECPNCHNPQTKKQVTSFAQKIFGSSNLSSSSSGGSCNSTGHFR
jgi:putative FmdB family regulatory protein